MKQKYTIRKFINDIHLWLGIASGLILFAVCLSGTLYTFHTEIEEWLDSPKYNISVPQNATAMSPDALIEKIQKEQKGVVSAVEISDNKNKPYRFTVTKKPSKDKAATERGRHNETEGAGKKNETARFEKPEKKMGQKPAGEQKSARPERGKTFLINQYTGETLGTTEGSASQFFTNCMLLHRNLLMEGETGKLIVGIATLIFVAMLLSGLVLWFPAKIRTWKRLAVWKPGFRIKFGANWKRVNHDLHNTLGFYSFLILLIMALTGLCWSFEWYRDGMSAVLKDEVFKQRRERPMPSMALPAAEKISLETVIATANKTLSYAGKYRISLPADSVASFAISKTAVGFAAFSGADKLNIDQYTGAVLKTDLFSRKPFNQKIAASIRSLHVGVVFSTLSKIIYFVCCLFATSLPVTGTIIWINKLKKKRRINVKAQPRLVSAV